MPCAWVGGKCKVGWWGQNALRLGNVEGDLGREEAGFPQVMAPFCVEGAPTPVQGPPLQTSFKYRISFHVSVLTSSRRRECFRVQTMFENTYAWPVDVLKSD